MKKLLITLSLFLFTQLSFAQEAEIRKALEPRLNGAKIDSVRKGPIPGFYEIKVGLDILYVDEKAQFMIAGQIQDIKTAKNFTQERLDALAGDAVFGESGRSAALKMVKGNGQRVIAIFEDPNCGYCKKLRGELEKMNNITVYTYLVPILTDDSVTKIQNIWCAKDKNKAYDDWMLRGVNPAAAPAACKDAPIEQAMLLARSLRMSGTPLIYTAQGQRIGGYVDAEKLAEAMAGKKIN